MGRIIKLNKGRKRFISISMFFFALLFMFTSCGDENGKGSSLTGNISEIVLEPGDVYAVIKFEGYDKEVTFKLFPDIAPIAVERFITLAERGYYDSKNIHRVIQDFVIQGGSLYGDGTDGTLQKGESFNIETSENARNFYGALCMAPDDKNKNSYQFYIVNNKQSVDIDANIQKLEEQLADTTKELKPEAKQRFEDYLSKMQSLPENIKALYKSKGGVFNLDGNNTVFGQLIEGAEVIDAISQVEVVAGNQVDDNNNIHSKPLYPVIIDSVEIVRIPLPEPTTVETEETTKRGKKTARTTTTPDEADPSQLTEVVAFGESQSVTINSDIPDDETEVDEDIESETDFVTETEPVIDEVTTTAEEIESNEITNSETDEVNETALEDDENIENENNDDIEIDAKNEPENEAENDAEIEVDNEDASEIENILEDSGEAA